MAKQVLNQDYDTSQIDTQNIAQTIEANRIVAYNHRRIHERRWYDNNFFDDGFHFRYLSRTTNKIVDLSERATIYTPQRSIPKASRQIRGIANLLLSNDPTPTVYPEETGSQDPAAIKAAKDEAVKRGYWLEEEWRDADSSGETLLEKLALMVILTAKHSISFIQIWADGEDIRTQVFDAFDIYVIGSYTNIEDLPFMIKATPLLVAQIIANPEFKNTDKVMPDNKPSESEIKQAYMRSRFGRDSSSDQAGTAILYEAFMKEYLNEDNIARIKSQKDGVIILQNRTFGDPIIRQVFTASGQVLKDSYLNMSEYPFVDLRLEPGPLYSVPLIERFINANKSLDSAVSRMERYFHTMVTGIWMKHRGENFKINNIAGGQVIEWDQRQPEQAQLSSPGAWTFEFMNLLESFIDEQGVSVSLGKIPTGVKAHAAIESMKEQEYSNLVISSRRMKEACRRIALKMFAIADDYYVTPHPVSYTTGGDTSHFQVIGKNALGRRKGKKIETPDNLISLSSNTKVEVEIEQGMAYTREGKKESMQNIIDTMLKYTQAGLINPEALKPVIQKYLEMYKFGSTAEFMDVLDLSGATATMSEEQINNIKIAVLQALSDVEEIGPKADKKDEEITKYAVVQALQDTGLAKNIQQAAAGTPQAQPKSLAESLNIAFKDLPEDTKADVVVALGFPRPQVPSPAGTEQAESHSDMRNTVEDNANKKEELRLKAEDLRIKEKQVDKPQPKGGANEPK